MAGTYIQKILNKTILNEDIINQIIYNYIYPKKKYLNDIIRIQKFYYILFHDQLNYYYYNYNYLLNKCYYVSNLKEYMSYHLDAVCYIYNIYDVFKIKKFKNKNKLSINQDNNILSITDYLVSDDCKQLKQKYNNLST